MGEENGKKWIKKTWLCLSAVWVLLFFWPAGKVRAAEPFYNWRIETISYTAEELQEQYADAVIVTDGYREVLPDETSAKEYRYTASEDTDFAVWLSDATGSDNNFRLYVRWSGGMRIELSGADAECKMFLKKGESVYISRYEFGKADGEAAINYSIIPAKAIQNISVVEPPEAEGYIERGAYFSPAKCAMQGKGYSTPVVEVTYVDGRKDILQIGCCFSWEIEGAAQSRELGSYSYTVYYRGYPISFDYKLKSMAEAMVFTPIKLDENVEVPYNNGEPVGYTFIPEHTGYYNLYQENNKINSFLVYEVDGRVVSDGYLWEMYLLEGVEYQVYVYVNKPGTTGIFYLDECLDRAELGLEVVPVEPQWYTGNPFCPEPVVTYRGKDIRSLYNYSRLTYTYHRNRKPGRAVVTIDYYFRDENSKEHSGTIRSSFMILQSIENAEVTIDHDTYVYTGEAIAPKERVAVGGIELIRDKDYTVEYSNNVNAGNAELVIKGTGIYGSSIRKAFQIVKANQEIAAENTVTTYKNAKAFLLKAKALGKLTYSSQNDRIASVDSKGQVQGKGYGKTSITIWAAQTDNYEAASKEVTVIVTSKPGKIASVKSSAKGKLQVKVKKVSGAQGYEITCATDKGFTKNVKKAEIKKTKKVFKKLKHGKTYYVRVRTYRKVKGEKLYSSYSPVRKIKVR